jgi:penicillin-binding protein-related factor A (putative recombinase)
MDKNSMEKWVLLSLILYLKEKKNNISLTHMKKISQRIKKVQDNRDLISLEMEILQDKDSSVEYMVVEEMNYMNHININLKQYYSMISH